MSPRSKLISKSMALLKEIKKTNKQENALHAKGLKLQVAFDKGLGKLLLATNALANYNWYASSTKFWLRSELNNVRDSKLVQFKELMYDDEDHGLKASFWGGKVNLYIWDSNVDLNFDSGATMSKFIINNKLTVNTTRLDEVIAGLQTDLEAYSNAKRYAKADRTDND